MMNVGVTNLDITKYVCKSGWWRRLLASSRTTSSTAARGPSMKSLHIAVLVAALAAAGCTTPGVPTALPAVAHATSPAPGIVSAGRLVPADVDEVRTAGIRQVIDLTP